MSEENRDLISYGEFRQRFFEQAVTEQRVLRSVNTLAGQPIAFGPLGVGPGRIAKVTARGEIGRADAQRVTGETVSYRVTLPVQLTFDVHLQADTHRFHADLAVPLVLIARAAAPLRVVVDVLPPHASQIELQLRAEGLRASMLNKVVGVEDELRRFVARYVTREIEKPAVVEARTIDVAAAIDGAYAHVAPRTSSSSPTEDLAEAFEEEISRNERLRDGLAD